jgi:pimeloyl-ACP methyl ester carboxylesterase/DNA-binding CsgD family transcriptional regulator
MEQEIRFCTSADGVRIAFARHGSGPPLVKAAHWLTHLEFDWESPVWTHWLRDLGSSFTVIRHDERGCGLSDREVPEHSLDALVADLEAVVEAAGLDRFALLGMSQGGPIAIRYAARRPERISHLVLYGTYGRGRYLWDTDPHAKDEADLLISLIRVGWARGDPSFLRLFTNRFIPGATEEQMRWFDGLQRRSSTAENATRSRRARYRLDVRGEARRLRVPTLVLHARHDQAVPIEEGRTLASLIPGARFIPLDSRNHILLEGEPAWPLFLREVEAFLKAAPHEERREAAPLQTPLSPREIEVLRLVAAGKSNAEIAAAIHLSERTVERHLSNVYAKLGLRGKAARAAAAATLSRLTSTR